MSAISKCYPAILSNHLWHSIFRYISACCCLCGRFGGAMFYDFQISLWIWWGATGECIQSNYNLSAHWFHVNTSSWWSIAQPAAASPPPPIHWYTMLLAADAERGADWSMFQQPPGTARHNRHFALPVLNNCTCTWNWNLRLLGFILHVYSADSDKNKWQLNVD